MRMANTAVTVRATNAFHVMGEAHQKAETVHVKDEIKRQKCVPELGSPLLEPKTACYMSGCMKSGIHDQVNLEHLFIKNQDSLGFKQQFKDMVAQEWRLDEHWHGDVRFPSPSSNAPNRI
jgi:hypothetical protein